TRTGLDGIFLFQLGRGFVIGSQEHVVRCTVLDLCVELAGGAERRRDLVAGFLLEVGGNGLHRCREVGRDGDLDFFSRSGRRKTDGQQADKQGSGKSFHGDGRDELRNLQAGTARMMCDALISAVALPPTLRPSVLTLSLVMMAAMVLPPGSSSTTSALTAPSWQRTTVPARALRALVLKPESTA